MGLAVLVGDLVVELSVVAASLWTWDIVGYFLMSTSIGAGSRVRIAEPAAGRAFAKFRGRVGVVQYAVPASESGEWVVAVERHETERATTHVVCQPENAFEFVPCATSGLEACEAEVASPSYRAGSRFKRARVSEAPARATRVAIIVPSRARATQGCFNVTSTQVFSDTMCQKAHPPFENLKRDDHSSKNQLKRVEPDRDMSLESREVRTLVLPRSRARVDSPSFAREAV